MQKAVIDLTEEDEEEEEEILDLNSYSEQNGEDNSPHEGLSLNDELIHFGREDSSSPLDLDYETRRNIQVEQNQRFLRNLLNEVGGSQFA
jgi:hypothetical protein